MPTLTEQLDQLVQHEHQQESLANAIEKLVSQPRIFNMLKKALINKFSAEIPYQRFDDEGFVNLEPKETSQFSSYNSYEFTINVEPRKNSEEIGNGFMYLNSELVSTDVQSSDGYAIERKRPRTYVKEVYEVSDLVEFIQHQMDKEIKREFEHK